MSARSVGDKDHPGWKLSRACICDAYLAKRSGCKNALLARCLTNLRKTQLAPYRETRMIANRFGMLHLLKKLQPQRCDCCWDNDFERSSYLKRADNPSIHFLCRDGSYLCESCLGFILNEVEATEFDDFAVIYLEGGLVGWIALPVKPVRFYLVADNDVFDGADIEEVQTYYVRLLLAHKPHMKIIY